MRALILVPLLSLIGPSGSATAQAANPYAAEPIVIVSSDVVYKMQPDGTGVTERTVVAKIQSQAALKEVAVLSLPFAGNSQHVEWVYARVRHTDGTVTETPIDNAIEVAAQVTREAPFYSDIKEMQLPLRDLRVGDQLEWKGRLIRTKAEAPGQFWSQDDFIKQGIVLSETLVLDVPKGQYVKVWSPKFKPAETDEGDRHIYRWSSSNLKPTVGPEADAFQQAEKKRVRTPEEEYDAREGKLPDVAWTTFKSWEDVGAWYRGLEADRMVPDAEVKSKVAQLTAGKTSEDAKIQAVYDYVSMHIHYIGVAFGIGRYQPHSAADVLANQYGDCKDKHTLLASMLEALGLHSDAVLIGAGIRFNQDVPSPASFNHLITHVNVGGKPTFLDSTAEVAPFGLLVFAIRDQPGLVIPDSGVARVERTAADPPFKPALTMNAVGSLTADGTSNSKIKLTFRGDEELVIRAALRQASPAQYDELSQRISASLGYGGTASHLEVGTIDDTSTPFQLSYDYKREKNGDWPNLRILAQLYPVTLPKPEEGNPPIESLQLGVPRVEVSEAAMTLPDGWGVVLPQAVHAKSEWANYDLTYRFEKGVFYTERRVEILKERVPVADWKAYSKFTDKADLGGDAYIQLTRAKLDAINLNPSNPGVIKLTSPEAARLVREAYEAIRQRNAVEGKSLLDQAKAINPEQADLWGGYGNLSLLSKDYAAAIEDYQKENKLHPRVSLYGPIASNQLTLNRRADAEQTFQQWADAEPQNPEPLRRLASAQLGGEEAAKAVVTANAAIAISPKDKGPSESLLLILGQAQMKAGMKDKGEETLSSLLKSTDDSVMINSVGYELANDGLDFPLVESKTLGALDKMEEETRAWTLDESLSTLRTKSRNLEATWDTVGWIYFRESKFTNAEDYIRASWAGRKNAEVGMHLGEIEFQKGDRTQALKDYALSIVSVTKPDIYGPTSQPALVQKELEGRADALRKEGVHAPVDAAGTELQNQRKLPLGAGPDGVAEYKILVNATGILRAEPVGDKQVKGAVELLKRAKTSQFFPSSSKAQLVFQGILNCHSRQCELVLEP